MPPIKMVTSIDYQQLLEIFQKAEKAVTAKKELLNNLNVYPVPDGDTGTNMSLTLKEIINSIGKKKDLDWEELCEMIEESSLMGARGNSGVILSQFIGGFCDEIKNRNKIDQKTLLHAFQRGTKEAYESVSDPVEGTILTVMKSATDEMEKRLEFEDFVKIFRSVLNRSQVTLKQTPEMLPKLKEAGVVDAGGAGFVYFLEGFYKALVENGEDTISATDDFSSPPLARIWQETAGIFGTGGIRSILDFNYKAIKLTIENTMWLLKKAWHVIKLGGGLISIRKAWRLIKSLSGQLKWHNIKKANLSLLNLLQVWQETPEEKYCTEAILTDVSKSPDEIKDQLSKIGKSVIVAQKGQLTKIHFHANDAEEAKNILQKLGKIERFKQDNIHEQHQEFISKKLEMPQEDKGTHVLAVINGSGFKQIYESFEGVFTIDGGETMNPSIAQFNRAISKTDTSNIIIIPNNKNVFLAAQKVASKSSKNIKVLETKDQAQGLTALLNFNKESLLSQNFEIMENALNLIKTFSITQATKDTSISKKKINKDEYIAISEKGLLTNGKSLLGTLKDAILMYIDKYQLVTLYTGNGISRQEAETLKKKLAASFKKEFQVYEGGQPNYHYIISLE
jgi:dihydroxyacetone kinase-like predicted kinase